MGLISHIKRPRKLALSHWRYRLLHWTWGINPATAEESSLPKLLYTHYCPLFHLTNLLVLTSVFILLFKLACIAVVAIVRLCRAAKCGWEALDARWTALRVAKAGQSYTPTEAELAEEELITEREIAKFITNYSDYETFEMVEAAVHETYGENAIDEARLKSLWESILPKAKAAKEAAEERKRRSQARIVAAVNISSFLLKGMAYLLYASLAVGVCYCLVFYTIPFLAILGSGILRGLHWLYTLEWVSVVEWLAIVTAGVLSIVAAIGLAVLAGRSKPIREAFDGAIDVLSVPYGIVADCNAGFWCALGGLVSGTATFFSELYSDNCPPIEVVSEEDAEIEATHGGDAC